jgi:hypothetical protein
MRQTMNVAFCCDQFALPGLYLSIYTLFESNPGTPLNLFLSVSQAFHLLPKLYRSRWSADLSCVRLLGRLAGKEHDELRMQLH